ncbi:phenylalanine--tRNA ligase subunit beta [candidate division WWE3 bacterium]|nr:phenylalanine--tRNA ligase subunit beta [candidate division WWE3 bacterium]
MKLPLVWLKDYIDTKKTPAEIADSFTSLGLMLDKPIENDVLDLEHRMDRADWLSIIGCARDFAAFDGTKLKKPDGLVPESNGQGGVKIKIEAPELVKRFNTRVFRGIKVGDSPIWIKERLESYGLPTINNIVDITNFVMVEYGQPMHAQDLSKFSKQEIVFRHGKAGEKVLTLLGQEVAVDSETLVMAEGNNLIGIGAIVGSKLTAVDNKTTDIILDAGNYNQSNIRKTSRRLNIRNETVARTEKFLHPELTQIAIERATKLILELAGGQYFENEDYYPNKAQPKNMILRFSRIKTIGGIDVDPMKVKDILTKLEYKIIKESTLELTLEIPFFRTDIEVEDDIVSDILRINDYKNIPNELMNSASPKEITPTLMDYEDKIRDILVNLGMHEHISSPMTMVNGNDKTQIILENALNSEQNALRTNVAETLRPVLEIYKKHKYSVIRLFEVGRTYFKIGEKYEDIKEIKVVEGIVLNDNGARQTNDEVKKILSGLFVNLGISNVSYKAKMENKSSSQTNMKNTNVVTIYQDKLELGELRNDGFTLFTENLVKSGTKKLRVIDYIPNKTYEDVTVELMLNETLGETLEKLKVKFPKAELIEQVDEFRKESKRMVTLRVYKQD